MENREDQQQLTTSASNQSEDELQSRNSLSKERSAIIARFENLDAAQKGLGEKTDYVVAKLQQLGPKYRLRRARVDPRRNPGPTE